VRKIIHVPYGDSKERFWRVANNDRQANVPNDNNPNVSDEFSRRAPTMDSGTPSMLFFLVYLIMLLVMPHFVSSHMLLYVV